MVWKPSEKVIRWRPQVDKWCVNLKISQSLVFAVMQMESGGNPDVTRFESAFEKRYILGNAEWSKRIVEIGISSKEAATSYGLMQLMFTTAYGFDKTITPAKLLDPDQNVRFGAALLKQKLKKFTVWETLCAYNGGDGAVIKYRKDGKPTKATKYADTVSALCNNYRAWMTASKS